MNCHSKLPFEILQRSSGIFKLAAPLLKRGAHYKSWRMVKHSQIYNLPKALNHFHVYYFG